MTVNNAFPALWSCVVLGLVPASAAELRQPTQDAFDRYIRSTESRLSQQVKRGGVFLWVEGSPERMSEIRKGTALTQPWNKEGEMEVPDGLIHDWVGAVFIPGVTLEKTLALVQNYDRHKEIYRPEVVDSRLLSRQGNDFQVYLRLLKKKVITVVLNTRHDVRYFPLDKQRWYSRSYSTRITEVRNPGEANETELPPGEGHGFLWRLYSYWKFQETGDGVIVECQAISLTRSVPRGLGWLVEPIIRNLPRESLANTLGATRAALVK